MMNSLGFARTQVLAVASFALVCLVPLASLAQDKMAAKDPLDSPIPMMAPAAAVDSAKKSETAAVPSVTAAPAAAEPAPAPASAPQPSDAQPPSLMDVIGDTVNKATDAATSVLPVPSPKKQALANFDEPPAMTGMDLPVNGADVSVDGQAPDPVDQFKQEAFDAMLTGLMPLDPPQIRTAFKRLDLNQKALEEPLNYPKPEVAFTTISLDPGATPLTFKLATNHVTTVSFLDMTGTPWPIQDVSWTGNFEVKAPTGSNDEKLQVFPNLLRIVPMSEYAFGNMSIRVLGLQTPITFTLRTNRDIVQYRLDIRIPEMGPFATPPLIQNSVTGLQAGDAVLTRVMEGVMPSDAEKLTVAGVDGRTSVYRLGGMVYVRTPLTLLSPGWNSSIRSADGMNVYAINNDAPVLLLSEGGQMVRAQVSESEGDSNE
jgi:intracellular multiplication protein IcmK